MALIKCPECEKEFSDKATACPNCGCPTSEVLSIIEAKRISAIDYEIDNDYSQCKACPTCGGIFWTPIAECYRNGYCLECRPRKLYDKLIKIDYLTADFEKEIGPEPSMYSKDYIKQTQQRIERIHSLERKLFEQYVSNWDSLDRASESYKLNMENMYNSGKGEIHTKIKTEAQERAQKSSAAIALANQIPKCPTCKSSAVQKISNTKKGFKMLAFGLFSDDFGKTFECRNCGYKW